MDHACYRQGSVQMHPSFRPALIQERAQLIELQRRASLANPGDRAALLANPDAVDIPESQIKAGDVIVAEIRGTCAGFSAIYIRGDGDAELDGLFVEPDRWRNGLGRSLLEAAMQRARAHGARKLHVIGNPHAELFYRKSGFAITGPIQTQFGTGLSMVLEIE